ncbi:hypothetical protein EG329_004097 [Mollisiaceae sp. DMI_Dod_QoI]|nr:hypothetical protein EG329_004097 [Helotiales sp. DMI_Dod_QoI]
MPFFTAFNSLPGEHIGYGSRSVTPIAYLNILQKYTAPQLIWAGGIKPFNYSAIERETNRYTETIDWLEIVERYSQCSLSYEDKLPSPSFPIGVEHITDDMELIKTYTPGCEHSDRVISMTWFDGPGALIVRTTVREVWIRDDTILEVPPGLKRRTRFRGMINHPPDRPSYSRTWKYLNPDIGWVSSDTQDLPEKLWCAKVGSLYPSL